MNNIEKNLLEIYEKFYYDTSIDELMLYLNEKFEKITKAGKSEGLQLDSSAEKDLLHRLLLEGVPFYLCDKLKNKLKSFEESISEQPMLLAHPSSIKNYDVINFIESKYISELVNEDYVKIDHKIYQDLYKYIYLFILGMNMNYIDS